MPLFGNLRTHASWDVFFKIFQKWRKNKKLKIWLKYSLIYIVYFSELIFCSTFTQTLGAKCQKKKTYKIGKNGKNWSQKQFCSFKNFVWFFRIPDFVVLKNKKFHFAQTKNEFCRTWVNFFSVDKLSIPCRWVSTKRYLFAGDTSNLWRIYKKEKIQKNKIQKLQ